jgi:hypothetical protein
MNWYKRNFCHKPSAAKLMGIGSALLLGAVFLGARFFSPAGKPPQTAIKGEPAAALDSAAEQTGGYHAAPDHADQADLYVYADAEPTGSGAVELDANAVSGPKTVRISYKTENSGGAAGGVMAHFFIDDPPAETFRSFEWDFGDGKQSFSAEPFNLYMAPKTYVARLIARDREGTVYPSMPLYIDVPRPDSSPEYSTAKFVTIASPDGFFETRGTVTKAARYSSLDAAPLNFSAPDQRLTRVRFSRPGFYGLTAQEAGGPEQYYSIFVSPLPSVHADADEGDFDWYRTQFNTGTTSNCGPASVAMAIAWSTGKHFPVSSVRQAVGWQGEGATSFEELIRVLKDQGIPAVITPISGVQSVRDLIDRDSIAVVLFRTEGVKTARGDPAQDLFGKYYNDSVGHYIVIKGYSLNGEYFVIHDPIPSDWSLNSFRYGDDLSMIGRNRYYSSAELLRSLRRADMIAVPRMTPGKMMTEN